MIQKWIDRIQNLLDVQKDLGGDTISASFDRRELVELRMMFDTLKEMEEQRNGKR